MAKRRLSEAAQVAKLCKAYLKNKNIKCNTRSSNFAGGDSVNIEVTDLSPAELEEIKKEFSKYEYGTFDGMTDCYEMTNVNRSIPQTKYLFIKNKISDEMSEKIKKYIAGKEGIKTEEDIAKADERLYLKGRGIYSLADYVNSIFYNHEPSDFWENEKKEDTKNNV